MCTLLSIYATEMWSGRQMGVVEMFHELLCKILTIAIYVLGIYWYKKIPN